jgi:hypothetical protein
VDGVGFTGLSLRMAVSPSLTEEEVTAVNFPSVMPVETGTARIFDPDNR